MAKRPPLADVSPLGRSIMSFQRFRDRIMKELDHEISGTPKAGEKAHLVESKERIKTAASQMVELAKTDQLRGVQIMNVALELMLASADAASRIDRQRMPLIIKRKADKDHGQPGGKESGRKRREVIEATWMPHAKELARQIRSEDPSITQANLADRIAERWKLSIHCPETQLIPAIRKWERSGSLAKRDK